MVPLIGSAFSNQSFLNQQKAGQSNHQANMQAIMNNINAMPKINIAPIKFDPIEYTQLIKTMDIAPLKLDIKKYEIHLPKPTFLKTWEIVVCAITVLGLIVLLGIYLKRKADYEKQLQQSMGNDAQSSQGSRLGAQNVSMELNALRV